MPELATVNLQYTLIGPTPGKLHDTVIGCNAADPHLLYPAGPVIP
ncbi:hypothetical protein QF036_002384 [Arthrobacter globiformis]|nr:hypothetical protein [Arthrobacter globiformis]